MCMDYLCPSEYDSTENTTNSDGKWPNSKQPNHTFASLVPPRQYKFAFFLLIQFFLQEPWATVENIVRILLFGPIHIFGVSQIFSCACPCKMVHILSPNELNYSLVTKHDYFYIIEWWLIMVTHVTKKSFLNPRKLCHLEILLVTIFTNVWGMYPIIF
jgi:hypothetical protein